MNSTLNIIGNLFLIYIVTQLITTAYGLTVIYTLKPIINQKLLEKGYKLRQRDSLYEFNDKFTSIVKGFIPFYYANKAIDMINRKNPIERGMDEEIVSGNYISKNEESKIFEETELEKRDDSLYIPQPRIIFEKPEKYIARKVDNSLYNTYETPEEYVEREMNIDESLKLTPFVGTATIENIVQSEVTSKDVARFISELPADKLKVLRGKIDKLIELNEMEENYKLTLEKDVA